MGNNRYGWQKSVSLVALLALMAGLLLIPGRAQADRKPSAPEPLPRIQSLEHLQKLLDSSNSKILYISGFASSAERAQDIALENAPVEAETGSDDFSGTNVQVEGVDEADLVKTDGSFIYQVKSREALIIQALPAAQMKVASRITFNPNDFTPCEMYAAGNQLVLIGNSVRLAPIVYTSPEQNNLRIAPPQYGGQSATRVLVYDITDRSAPVKIRELELEGSYLTSRRIDSALYVISHQPVYRIMAENWQPAYRDSVNGEQFTSIPVEQIAYFPNSVYHSYLLMAGLRLDQPQKEAQMEVVLGSADNVYASAGNMYVATPLNIVQPILLDRSMPIREEDRTQIFRFSLDKGAVAYAARGEVPGRTLNQFSMDEYRDIFRIATTSGQEWWNRASTTSNNMYTLDSDMNILGRVENIAPGELIYSTRFMGERAYMVTFRTVDPFFVIDMSDPASLRILGKLKIPGYSNYLHPYDENNIMGFGKDTIELKTPSGQSQAYYQGMKMSMFDVSNLAAPIEKDLELIGDRGTESELLNNHRALLFSREKNLLAFPVTVMEVARNSADTSDKMLQYGSFAFQGAYIYQVNGQGFTLRGRISHLEGDDYLKAGDYWGGTDKSIRRILYIGDTLYTVSDAMIQAHRLEDLRYIGALRLDQ